VDGEEAQKRQHGQEMDGPGGLAALEQVQEPGGRGVEAGGHRKPGQDHQRQGDEQDRSIGQLLQDAVIGGVVEAQPCVISDVPRQGTQVGRGRDQLAQMTVQRRGQKPEQQRCHQHPGEEEVDQPARSARTWS